ncbi:copper amine oxidase N-terminal domain-containing protein [Peptoniphilus catoniae]|uniref:copper amine oxidase N-terminal domain-containing protein n=1 Tax=Peptoniphilus catoniae TaxID=1660341 RepID=UPI0010FF2EF5|nr:copper amine oxidase N-terminal domain-containing protein [Peptoniphilus catoniae]
MKKNFLKILPLAILLLIFSKISYAQEAISLYVDGKLVTCDTAPIIKNDRVLVPVRFVAENLGLKVSWEGSEKRVAIFRPGAENTGDGIFLWIGEKIIGVGEETTEKIDVAPIIVNGRTMVPIRVIAEIFDRPVNWDDATRSVYIGKTENIVSCGEVNKLPIQDHVDLVFSSGVGNWETYLRLYPNGDFIGKYYDINYGESGKKYPGGTMYICIFNGSFSNIKKVDDYTYAMTIKNIKTKYPLDKTWIKGNMKNIASEPYGLENGKEFEFYLPGKPTKGLSEDFLLWNYYTSNEKPLKLETHALRNLTDDTGFFNITDDLTESDFK